MSVRAYFTRQDATNIEKCFQILGKQMPQPDTHFAVTMVDDFRREYDAIQSPGQKAIYAFWTVRRVQHFIMGEYSGLTDIAELTGNWAVASLLEHNLVDKVDFIERTREFFRDSVRHAIGARVAGRAA